MRKSLQVSTAICLLASCTRLVIGQESLQVSYVPDAITAPYMTAGLVRYLDENAGNPDQAMPIEPSKNAETSEAPALNTPSVPAKPPIQLAPLASPDTSTQSIGTGVVPDDVTLDRLPPDQMLPNGVTRDGSWAVKPKPWVPGGFCHQPLYFEEPMLERHGHVRFPYLQPMVSGARFFGTFPVMPYLATLRHPLDDVHTLGAYQPGTAAPMLRYRAHYDPKALRNEVIAVGTTAVFLDP